MVLRQRQKNLLYIFLILLFLMAFIGLSVWQKQRRLSATGTSHPDMQPPLAGWEAEKREGALGMEYAEVLMPDNRGDEITDAQTPPPRQRKPKGGGKKKVQSTTIATTAEVTTEAATTMSQTTTMSPTTTKKPKPPAAAKPVVPTAPKVDAAPKVSAVDTKAVAAPKPAPQAKPVVAPAPQAKPVVAPAPQAKPVVAPAPKVAAVPSVSKADDKKAAEAPKVVKPADEPVRITSKDKQLKFTGAARSTACDGTEPYKYVAVITGFWDIKNDLSTEDSSIQQYMAFAANMLQVNVKMVIYTEEKFIPFIQYYRQGKEAYTEIVTKPISEMDFYKYRDDIESIQNSNQFQREFPDPNSRTGKSAEYVIMKNSKVSLLAEASERKMLGASYYYWMDMIFARGDISFLPKRCDWSPRKLMVDILRDKMTFFQVDDFDVTSLKEMYQRGSSIVGGAFFGGTRNAVARFKQCHVSIFEEDLIRKGRVDTEQTVIVGCALVHPDLCNFVKGRWYDAFNMLY